MICNFEITFIIYIMLLFNVFFGFEMGLGDYLEVGYTSMIV